MQMISKPIGQKGFDSCMVGFFCSCSKLRDEFVNSCLL